MSKKQTPDLEAMARRVENFIVRARQVKAHSLAEVETLRAMVSSGFGYAENQQVKR